MKNPRLALLPILALPGWIGWHRLPAETPAPEEDDQGLVEIHPEFPKPLFLGTPVPVKVENFEPPRAPKLSFKAPAGTTNIARGKPVTSSDPNPIFGTLDLTTDGDKTGTDGTYVELIPGKQWIQIDLEKTTSISALVLWHYHKTAVIFHDVVIQVSNDPDFEKGVTTVFNNDHDNSSELGVGKDKAYVETNHGRIVEFPAVKGRYVRLWSKGNTANEMNHYVEVEVYGKGGHARPQPPKTPLG